MNQLPPFASMSDALLREERIRTECNLGRLSDTARYLAQWLDMQDTRFLSSTPDEIKAMLAPRDFDALATAATEASRAQLEHILDEIDAEFERRHQDKLAEMDQTGGIAA